MAISPSNNTLSRMSYKHMVEENLSLTDGETWLVPEATLKAIASHVNANMSIQPEAFCYLDTHLQSVLRLTCANQPTKIADVEERIRTIFSPKFSDKCIESAHAALEKGFKRKPGASFPVAKMQAVIQRNFLTHTISPRGDNSLTLFIISVLEFLTTDFMKRLRDYFLNLKEQLAASGDDRNWPSEVGVVDVKMHADMQLKMDLTINNSQIGFDTDGFSSTAPFEVVRHRKGSSTYEDAVKVFIQDHKSSIQELCLIKKVFKPVFYKVISSKKDTIYPEELTAIFGGIDDLLETSSKFLDLLEESSEMEGFGFGVASAFEEMIEANDFYPFREYAKRILESFSGAASLGFERSSLSPYDAINRVLARKDVADIFVNSLPVNQYPLETVRYVLPLFLLTPIFRVSQLIESLKIMCSLLAPTESQSGVQLATEGTLKENVSECLMHSEPELRTIADFIENLIANLPAPQKRRIETLSRYYSQGFQNCKISEIIKSIEDSEDKLKELKQSRLELILEGDLEKLTPGKKPPTSRRAFLFDSGLILCKSNRQHGKPLVGPEYRLKEKFSVQKMSISSLVEGEDPKLVFEITQTEPVQQQIVLKTKFPEEKELWLGWLFSLLTKAFLEKLLNQADATEEAAHPLRLPIPELYKFSEPDSADNIIFCDDNVQNPVESRMVRAATQEKLVERLTYHQLAYPNFTKSFLITFRSFMKLEQQVSLQPSKGQSKNLKDLLAVESDLKEPLEPKYEKVQLKTATHNLMDLLIDRYQIPEPYDYADGTTQSAEFNPALSRKRFLKNYCIPVQTRVLVVMKHWVEHHFSDFENDQELLGKLQEFLESEEKEKGRSRVMRTWISTINKIISRKLANADVPREPQFPGPKPEFKMHLELNVEFPLEFNWMTLHPVEIARQITLLEFEYYRAIRASELVDYKPGADDRNQRCSPNIRKNAQFSTKIANSLSKFIVQTENLEERVAVVNRIIEIMRELFRLNNFYGVVEIHSCLESAPVHRLSKTMDALSSKLIEQRNKISQICAPLNNGQEYFRYLRSINPPCIPFLGLYLTHLQYICDGNPEYLDRPSGKKLINFSRHRRVADIVIEIQQYQNQPYCLQVNDSIKHWLENLDPYDGMTDAEFRTFLFEQSLKIEPRDASCIVKFPKRFDFSLKSPLNRPAHLTKAAGAGTLGHGPSTCSLNSLMSPMISKGHDDKCKTPSTDSTPAQSPLYTVPEASDSVSFNGTSDGDDVTLSETCCDPLPPPVPPRQPRLNRALDGSSSPRSPLSSSSSSFPFSFQHSLLTPPLPARPSSSLVGSTPNLTSLGTQFVFEHSPTTPAAHSAGEVRTLLQPSTPEDESPPPLPPKTLPRSINRHNGSGNRFAQPPELPPRRLKPDPGHQTRKLSH